MPHDDRRQPDRSDSEPPRKRRYKKPELKTYGHVSKLTQSGGSTNPEAGNPAMMQQCL